MLQTGDPCPCCGRPIKSRDPDVLALLTLIGEGRYLPTMEEIKALSHRAEQEREDEGHG